MNLRVLKYILGFTDRKKLTSFLEERAQAGDYDFLIQLYEGGISDGYANNDNFQTGFRAVKQMVDQLAAENEDNGKLPLQNHTRRHQKISLPAL